MKTDNKDEMLIAFNCIDCPGAQVKAGITHWRDTGICECEVECCRCHDSYIVRWDPERPTEYVRCSRRVLLKKGYSKPRYYDATVKTLALKKQQSQIG
jgi:hypothetical protein